MNKKISPETKKISIPIGGFFITVFIIVKLLHDIFPNNVIVNDIGQAIRHYLPILEKRYSYSLEAFGFASANWQVTYLAGVILAFVASFCYSLCVRFTCPELCEIYARYVPTKDRSAIVLIILTAIAITLFVSIVFFPWMPKLIDEPRLHGPIYRVVPDGVSWSNGWDALLLYMASQAGVLVRGLFVIIKPPSCLT